MNYRLCRHIKTNGLQCQSPAMRSERFCYYHLAYRRRGHTACPENTEPGHAGPGADAATSPAAEVLDLGSLEDAASIQVAISTVVRAVAARRIDAQQASVLFAGLRLAAANYRNLWNEPAAATHNMMREADHDDEGELIAYAGLRKDETWIFPEHDPDPDGEDADEDDDTEEPDAEAPDELPPTERNEGSAASSELVLQGSETNAPAAAEISTHHHADQSGPRQFTHVAAGSTLLHADAGGQGEVPIPGSSSHCRMPAATPRRTTWRASLSVQHRSSVFRGLSSALIGL